MSDDCMLEECDCYGITIQKNHPDMLQHGQDGNTVR